MSAPLRHVAVNTRLLLPDRLDGIGRFSHEALRRLVLDHPDVEFSFFFDRHPDEAFIFADNVSAQVLRPKARHPFLYMAWFNYAVTSRLRKLSPDVFFSPDGYLSLRTRVPQVAAIHDLGFEHYPRDVRRLEAWYYRRYFPRYAHTARIVVTGSEFTKDDIVQRYGVEPEKVVVGCHGSSAGFHPISAADQQRTRTRFARGSNFFHFVGTLQPRKNLPTLIRGFELFKAETGSDLKLVLVGRPAWKHRAAERAYERSPVRDEIVFTGYLDDRDLNAVHASSEALCFVSKLEGFGIPLLEAMHCEVPIIASSTSAIPEVAGEAALLVDHQDPRSIAAAMRRILEEPDTARLLVETGRRQRALFTWRRAADTVWQALLTASAG